MKKIYKVSRILYYILKHFLSFYLQIVRSYYHFLYFAKVLEKPGLWAFLEHIEKDVNLLNNWKSISSPIGVQEVSLAYICRYPTSQQIYNPLGDDGTKAILITKTRFQSSQKVVVSSPIFRRIIACPSLSWWSLYCMRPLNMLNCDVLHICLDYKQSLLCRVCSVTTIVRTITEEFINGKGFISA